MSNRAKYWTRRKALRILQETIEKVEGFSCRIHHNGLVTVQWHGCRWKLSLEPMRNS